MKMRHPMCKDTECRICLEDHNLLRQELEKRCGTDRVDFLGAYHSFMQKRPGGAETEYGWATPVSFEEENIAAFCREWLGEDED